MGSCLAQEADWVIFLVQKQLRRCLALAGNQSFATYYYYYSVDLIIAECLYDVSNILEMRRHWYNSEYL
jgi:hypothetical protein